MKTIKIKGRDYVTVAERIRHLASDEFPHDYSIETRCKYYPELKMWLVKATLTVYTQERTLTYTGHAKELVVNDTAKVNFAAALENAETSAIGRACAFAGIGIVDGIASADEIKRVEYAGGKTESKDTKTYSDSELPWLTEDILNMAIAAILKGTRTYEQVAAKYRMKKEYREQLKAAQQQAQ